MSAQPTMIARPQFHPAIEALSDPRLLREQAYVGGRWIAADSGRTFEVTDPASGQTLAFVAALGAAETT